MTPLIIRHGDVLLIRRGDPAPHTSSASAEAEIILAHGEATGHAHRLRGRGVAWAESGHRLHVPAGGLLTHEEHSTLEIPMGEWEIRIQQTTTQEGRWERVRD